MEVASTYLVVTFACALVAMALRLPPLVGFLAAGFVLAGMDAPELPGLDTAASLGVTLLLFGIGLKLDVRVLLRREVWFTATAHMLIYTVIGAGLLKLFMVLGLPFLDGLPWPALLIIGFAFSYSSTVLVVKVLEDRGESQAFYGRIAIGVLVLQDIAAVVFIVASSEELPSPWVPALVLVWPISRMLRRMWSSIGHGEMQVLFGVVAAFVPGYAFFDAVGLKGDLGALVMGLLLASHPAATELTRHLSSVKNLLLVAFFINIGMTGVPHPEHVLLAVLLLALVPLQGLGYSLLLRVSQISRHTTSRAGLALANFSEFGLIVLAVAVSVEWVSEDWLTVGALAVALSFVLSAAANRSERLADSYARLLPEDPPLERLHPECRPVELGDAQVLVLGMGRVGKSAARQLKDEHGCRVIGLEQSREKVPFLESKGWTVIESDASDVLVWDAVVNRSQINLVVVALPSHETSLDVLAVLRSRSFTGTVAAMARYPDHVDELRQAGADVVLQVYDGAGTQLADEAFAAYAVDEAFDAYAADQPRATRLTHADDQLPR